MKNLLFALLVVFAFTEIVNSQIWIQKLQGTSFWAITKDYQGNIYAGGTSKNIYKSTNNGDNWSLMFSGGLSNILYITCDSNNNVLASYGAYGVLKSTNGGLNWSEIAGSNFGSNTVNAVAYGKPGHIFVGTTGGGIYRSTDGGLTFPDVALTGSNIVTIYVDAYNYDKVFAGASSSTAINGIFMTTNSGANWSDNLTPGNNSWGMVQKSATEIFSAGSSTGYAFMKTSNGGLNWQTIYNFASAKRGLTADIAGNFYASGNGGTFKSTNNGVSFFNFNFTISANQCISNGNRIFVATSGSSNGGIWIYTDTTLTGVKKESGELPDRYNLHQNYPNPFNSMTKIEFEIPGLHNVKLTVFDILGREVRTLVNERLSAGKYALNFDAAGLSSGLYYFKMDVESGKEFSAIRKMVLTR